MAMKVNKPITTSRTRFSAAPMAELEFSTLNDSPRVLTTLNAGDIVPIYCAEVLPHQTESISLDFVTRQSTMLFPVMGELVQDFYAFFVPNRVVNKGWKNVMGENTSGAWIAPEVSLAPLYADNSYPPSGSIQIPVGSIADYYGFPTQKPIPKVILSQCHDLKFRGYLEIYNQYFRSQSYMPPKSYSKLNVYNNFLSIPDSSGVGASSSALVVDGRISSSLPSTTSPDGGTSGGSVANALVGDGGKLVNSVSPILTRCGYTALMPPLKAHKLLDYFSSVLPSPQRGRQVQVPMRGEIPLNTLGYSYEIENAVNEPIRLFSQLSGVFKGALVTDNEGVLNLDDTVVTTESGVVDTTNVIADLNESGISLSVNDLRLSSAMQRVYEILGNGGSRYTEFVNSFFGLEVENPFDDIPTLLGHFRRDLDMYQTAQTSASPDRDTPGTSQGNLAAFGYTNKDGKLFTKTFLEHGYIHIFTVIRHRNVYSSMLSRDNFRLNMLDFYSYPLANIGEQPVYTREINPFDTVTDDIWGYQEAWGEYRYEPDRVTGLMRDGVAGSLAVWNYSDPFDDTLRSANDNWLKSNTDVVVERSTALTEREYPQFKLEVKFNITKELPMPVYSVPGADIF